MNPDPSQDHPSQDHPAPKPSPSDIERFDAIGRMAQQLESVVGSVVLGQPRVVRDLIVALLAGGHTLLIGVPGLAKTLLVRTLAAATGLSFGRIQFTPDTMPSDVIGAELIEEDPATGKRAMRFVKGPIFAQLLLADEVNRTPPKTQAALLEAMAEHQATVAGVSHRLPEPFLVVATQNPIEQEGTYPLPEAQLDRFTLCLAMDYPAQQDERRIVAESRRVRLSRPQPVTSPQELSAAADLIERMPVAQPVIDEAVRLSRVTRPEAEEAPEAARQFIQWGAGTRAAQALVACARADAAMQGKPTPEPGDVRRFALPVLRHRVVLNYTAAGEGLSVEAVLGRVLQQAGGG